MFIFLTLTHIIVISLSLQHFSLKYSEIVALRNSAHIPSPKLTASEISILVISCRRFGFDIFSSFFFILHIDMGLHSYTQPSSSSLQVWSSGWSSGQPEVNFRPPISGIPDKCLCGRETVMKCSMSDDTRGRLFFGCDNLEDGEDHIMKWWDEAIMQELQEIKERAAIFYLQDAEDTRWVQEELTKAKALLDEVRLSERRRQKLVDNVIIAGIMLFVVLLALLI